MRHTWTLWLTLLLLSLLLSSCGGGGGGGSGSDTSMETPEDRTRLFVEEAMQRVRDRSHAQCESVTCDGDGEHSTFFDGALGTIFESCLYSCMPSEIDMSGEVRHYFVRIQFDRTRGECFEPEGDIAIFFEVMVSCVETL